MGNSETSFSTDSLDAIALQGFVELGCFAILPCCAVLVRCLWLFCMRLAEGRCRAAVQLLLVLRDEVCVSHVPCLPQEGHHH